jgi:two-component sensor histidine kinase
MTTHPIAQEQPAEPAPADGRDAEPGYLVHFERLIIELSGRLINLQHGSLDREINEALAAIGRFAGVDRSYLFRFSPDGRRMSNTHEWCVEGIEATMGRVQEVPVERFAWAIERLRSAGVLHVPDVSRMGESARAEREEFRSQGVRSLVNVPLVCGGRMLGFIGFDSVRAPKTWSGEHIRLLRVVGELIAGTIERERAMGELTQQVAMETLVAEISTGFIRVGSEGLDGQIDLALARIGTHTGVDRSYLFRLSPDGRLMCNTHEWCAPGIEPHIERLQGHPVEAFRWSMQWLGRGEVFHVADVSALPEEAAAERAEFEREDIKTLITVPIMEGERMTGFLGFDAVRRHRVWEENDIRLLRLLGEMIGGALARRSAEERLRISLEEKDVLLREVHHRVKNNLQVVHSLLYLQAHAIGAQADPVALDAFRQSCARIRSMAVIHERLYRAEDLSAVDFGDYLQALLPDLLDAWGRAEDVAVAIAARGVRLPLDVAIPCGLIVNELVTNCLEHAFPGRGGSLSMTLRPVPGGLLELGVADDGVGFAPARDWRQSGSLGLQLVGDLVDQLDGEVLLESGPGRGTRFQVRFPVAGG